MSDSALIGWDRLRHGGLLLDTPRLQQITEYLPAPLSPYFEGELRRQATALLEGRLDVAAFSTFILEKICGFEAGNGAWKRGPQIGPEWTRRGVAGEGIRPRQLWQDAKGGVLPVFFDSEKRIGLGRGRKAVSQVLQWLRAGDERMALITNGRQWRLLFAGLDFDAWCEWDVDLWFEEGALSPQVTALRTLLSPRLWTPSEPDALPPLHQAVLDSRKGQAELSAVLGERVREAVEILVQAHGEVLKERCAEVDPADIYRAAVRVVMRLVVILFAEARELLPCSNAIYHNAYGLGGLLETLERIAARGTGRLSRSWNAWPRILALFRLVHQGSHHEELPVPTYGGELFAPGNPGATDGLHKALAVFESACFDQEVMCDRDVLRMLERITRTRVKVRQGRSSTWVPAPVDFSDLSTEYIGILYEGLLDFKLKTAPPGDPIVFLAVGNQPALPLSRLEAMDDRALANLLEKMKDTSRRDEEEGPADEELVEPEEAETQEEADETEEDFEKDLGEEEPEALEDERYTTRTRAEKWARRAVVAGKLAPKPRGKMTPEKRLAYEEVLSARARRLVARVVLPGEWYLVRWGGTRKGAGTFYTRPGLAVPTVQRTLRPLAFDPPLDKEGKPDLKAPPAIWAPKRPEDVLALKVCDPACGSGTFLVAALRFLTDALYSALHHHQRIREEGERIVVALLSGTQGVEERLSHEFIPCRTDDELFERRFKALLRRHVVERCIYGVDLDPLAVELCRLSLWLETMDRELPFSFLDHKVKCGNSLVGAWFDQFQHYPVMAWKNREGGGKNHTNGVHYKAGERTAAIKAFVKDKLTPDLQVFLSGRTLFHEDLQEQAASVHEDALAVLSRLHELPVQDAAERARIYREELLGSEAYGKLKAAMDLWCACWFWPADELEHAPLPTTFASPTEETMRVAQRIAAQKRFFHWELEFPDVFRCEGSGFDGMLGNPPWDIAKPSSKEFFSNVDPLYRSYGKQEALSFQTEYFRDPEIEAAWLDYCADFKAQSNFAGHAASPFGDPIENEKSQDRFSIRRGKKNLELHDRWRKARAKTRGFADPRHPYRHQGSADINLYKLFLERVYALLRKGGRLGFIVPSGLYSDHGTGSLRRLFLDQCRWEWLFGFENREGIFEIHRSYKFNPVIVQKGGKTEAIQTAFMRRKLEDWERAEALATPYTREQVERFSPRSRAVLEIQSRRDLEILEKIYANSVLLGDDGPGGWGIKYATEFHMTNDSRLFPPRPWWEAQGYRPDEYSRWLKGKWRPIQELWEELGIDPGRPVPLDPACEAALRETEVIRGHHPVRCSQPPYNKLPVPRADIPAGIVLSRAADAWIHEDEVEDIALPLYEGRMIGQFDFSQKGWVSGKGRGAVWREIPWERKQIEPQFLIGLNIWCEVALSGYLKYLASASGKDRAEAERERLTDPQEFSIWWWSRRRKVAFIDVTSATNMRTMFSAALAELPCGNSAPVLNCENPTVLPAILNSISYDTVARLRCGGVHLNWFVIEESTLPASRELKGSAFAQKAVALGLVTVRNAEFWVKTAISLNASWKSLWALTDSERVRLRCALDAGVACKFGLALNDMRYLLSACDHPNPADMTPNPKGFWRVDKDKDPELRHTVLTLVAFHDLEQKIRECGGDREKGIEAFLNQNNGEGWMLPETLRLADYGLGHDERAREPQPVASRLGPRFYDWQLAQSPQESWRECHLHARNLLGKSGYFNLLSDVLRDAAPGGWQDALVFACELSSKQDLLEVMTKALGKMDPAWWQERMGEARKVLSEHGFSLDRADMSAALGKALRQVPKELREAARLAVKDLLGEADYRRLLAELEAKDEFKVAEPGAAYDAYPGKMTQRRLFD